jgi:uncharacterized protein YbjT (DUF2867 family)
LKLLVLGATGRTGAEVVSAAGARGHRVTALTRRLPADPGEAQFVLGDPLAATDLSNWVRGVDVVVSCLGQTSGGAPSWRNS